MLIIILVTVFICRKNLYSNLNNPETVVAREYPVIILNHSELGTLP